MTTISYKQRRAEIENYFDRTAAEAWSRLTSDAPVSRIRRTVREGRDQMRSTILAWLPDNLHGRRLLDAGCGTGALSVEAAKLGADVVATDLSPNLIEVAQQRIPEIPGGGSIEFTVGDMSSHDDEQFDHIVCMDSLIHYNPSDAVETLAKLAQGCSHSLIFTFAPSSVLLTVMHNIGRFFPRANRAPSIVPVYENKIVGLIEKHPELTTWKVADSKRIKSGFYTSQAVKLIKK